MKNYRLNKNLSVYLDILRTIAALLVFVGHVHTFLLPNFSLSLVFSHAREAVAIFFVLSGFVISFVVNEKEGDWRSYVIARASRIYPVAILALIVTFLADYVTFHVAGASATASGADSLLELYSPPSLYTTISSLLFTNQIWFNHIVFGSNEPYWSLGFEVWYYIFFGIFIFSAGAMRVGVVILWILFCGPKIILYLPLWLIGVFAYRCVASNKLVFSQRTAVVLMLATPILYLIVWKFLRFHVTNMYLTASLGQELFNFCYFMTVGSIVFINILAFNSFAQSRVLWSRRLEKGIRWTAGSSFTLYLMHQPILIMIVSAFPKARDSAPFAALAACATLLAILALAEVAERRKKVFANLLRFFETAQRPNLSAET
jgi:peptidoglycan/LPS O-acetylase OafA/YrhL